MTVWIANPYDNLPIEGYRPQRYWLMARAFARAGHDVTLWTSDFSHAHKRRRAIRGEVKGDGFDVRLVPTPPYPKNICLKRIFSHLILSLRWRRAAEREQNPDIVICSSPPLSLCAAVRRFSAARSIPYIVDVMDAWPETFERILPRPLLAPLAGIARRNYLGAAGVSAVARRYGELVRGYGVAGDIHVCPHGIERVKRAKSDPPPSGTGALRLVYCGTMGASYDLATVIDAVKDTPAAELDLAGAGPSEAALRERAKGCPRIRFHGYLDECALRRLFASSSAGIIPMFPESCVGIPYKLADYANAGLPVVNSLAGECAQLIAECGAGFAYTAGSAESLASALDALAAADRSALRAGAERIAQMFDADALYPEYVRWAEKTARAHR